MITYFLNDQLCPGPLQVDGLTLRKERNRMYWGFLYRKLGFLQGNSNLQFQDDDSVQLLKQTVERYGVQGETAFRIEELGNVLYDGFIDYATYKAETQGILAGLRDDKSISDFSSQATTVFSLTPTATLGLHTRRLTGLPSLVADPKGLTVQRSSSSATSLTHSVPLTRRVEHDEAVAGTVLPVITPLASDRMYYNSTTKDQLVTLRGTIIVTAQASTTNTITLRAVPIGNDAGLVNIGSCQVTATPAQLSVLVNVSVWVKVGQSLKLEWLSSGSATSWNFTYSTDMSITIGDSPPVDASIGYGLTAYQAFTQLVSLTTLGKLTFQSDFLKTDPDGQLWLANGFGIRGVVSSLNVSMQALFVGLTKLFNLALWIDGATVRLERKRNRPKTVTRLETVLSYSKSIATDVLYNSVKAGTAIWQAQNSSLSNDEPNGQRTYSTGITAVRNELDLVSDLITASNVIEQQRRLQFDPASSSPSKANDLDNALFLVATAGTRAETTERTSSAQGVYDPETLYNMRLTVGRCVGRFSEELSPCQPLTRQAVQGSDALTSVYDGIAVAETEPLPRQPFTVPYQVTITTPMSLDEYAGLGDWIEYPLGSNLKIGELLDAEWNLTKTGAIGTLTLLER